MRIVSATPDYRIDCEECNEKGLPKAACFDVDLGGYTKSYMVCAQCLLEAQQDLMRELFNTK